MVLGGAAFSYDRGTPVATADRGLFLNVGFTFAFRLLRNLATMLTPASVQGYLAHKKQRTPRTLQEEYA